MAMYATSTGTLPTALLLKGGDKVVIGFAVDLLDTVVNSANAVDGTNTAGVANSHPNKLTASQLTVSNEARRVSIAVRLQMPGSGAIEGIRAAA
jgi:hypothetical protein